jgi:hypothetical protein
VTSPADDGLVTLTDDERVRAAVAARTESRRRHLEAEEEATLVGTLRDLAERGAAVVVATSTRTHRGRLTAVAPDHLALLTPAGSHLLVRLDAVATVRPEPDLHAPVARGERPAPHDRRLLEECALWAADRPAVAVALIGVDDPVRGALVAVGEDVVTIRPDGAAGPVYVAAAAIEAIST